MSGKLYSVVRFCDNAVDFVPSKWICHDNNKITVQFPKKRTAATDNLKQNPDSEPNPKWPKWEVVIITGSNDATKAERKAAKYVETSDLESSSKETEPCIKKRRIDDHRQFDIPTANLHGQPIDPIQSGRTRLQLANSAVSHNLPVNQLQTVETAISPPLSSSSQSAESISIQGTTTAENIFPCNQRYFQLVEDAIQQSITPEDPSVGHPLNNSNFIPLTSFQLQGCNNQTILENTLTELREFQTKSLENQAIFMSEQREIKSLLLNVLKNCGPEKESTAIESVFSYFPLQDESQLHKVDEEISDRSKFDLLVKALTRFGRSAPSQTINSMLSYLFHHEFSKAIRYTQLSGKIPFGNLRLAEAIREVTRKTHVSIKDKEVNEKIAAWFRGSEDRAGGRKLRHGNSKKDSEKESQENRRDGIEEHPISTIGEASTALASSNNDGNASGQ